MRLCHAGGDVRMIAGQLRESKVEHLRVRTCRQENVGRLDIAMDHALLMCGVEGIGDLERDVERLLERQRDSGAEFLVEGLTLEKFHGDELLADTATVARTMFALDRIDGADVGMVQGRGGSGLA